MASINAQVQLINHTLNKLPKEIKRAKAKIETKAVRKVVKAIRDATPVDSGNLKKSVGRLTGLKRAKYTYVGIRAGKKYKNDGYYAPFLEYGTVNMPARPFFDRAAKRIAPSARKDLIDGAKLVLQEFKVKNSR